MWKRILEKIIEGVLMLSGSVTSITICLIIFFLFKEGIHVFKDKPIETGSTVVLNKNNTIHQLSGSQVKEIFDGEIVSWDALGGRKDTIIQLRADNITNFVTEDQLGPELEYLGTCIDSVIGQFPSIIAYIPSHLLPQIKEGREVQLKSFQLSEMLRGKEWFPTATPATQLGLKPLLIGTLIVSLGAILLALPFGLGTAIYLSEIAGPKTRNFLKPVIELLAGIPSVVFGFFGLVVIVPFIQKLFNLPVGETALAGSIVLGIMAIPTIITISEDAMRSTPRAMREASLALGANKWQTIHRVVIPYSLSGISAAVILGIGRAMGETMAVLMVTGNSAIIPHSILEPVRTIPATIAAELGEAAQGGLHYNALFLLGCILFLITLTINIIAAYISNKRKFQFR